MDNQLNRLYEKIKEGKISYEDALKQIKEYKTQLNQNYINTSSLEHEHNATSHVIAGGHTSLKASVPLVNTGLLGEKTLYQLKVIFGEVTKLYVTEIDAEEPLESYGIDSVMITQLNQKLAGIFGELSKTLFFEYQTLGALTEYFIAEYPQECMKWNGLLDQAKLVTETAVLHFDEEFPVLTSLKAGKKLARNLNVAALSNISREPIAIIGMSGRYPQAKNIKEYWQNLSTGKDCITEIPEKRWPLEGFYHDNPQEAVTQGKSYSKWGGFVEGFADFDPLFFNISPREAINMDPQERLFIEACWEVLEDAGYTKEQLAVKYNRRVGVFAGITKTGFNLYGPDLWQQGEQVFPRTSFSSVANRVSYLLNLQGPSMPIDTMCSSSLTAIHEACEHIYQGECELAIAGGVNLYLHPSSYIELCAMQMLSLDGQCKSFGQGGNGFVPGEGVGAVLLKRLSQAVADRDQIYAVIRGTSINHGGKTNGYTIPNPIAQGELIRAALGRAGINARAISYIEAHGTGTELGDPIEITGISQAFQKDSQDKGFCAIGSVKSNIGHLEAAAGIAGVTKIVLQMKHQRIAPSLHAKELNPNINFAKTPFVVQQELTEWKRPVIEVNGESREYPRIAGISSFGAGGANAHVVIEEYIERDQQPLVMITPHNPAMILLSAKNEERLQVQAQQLLAAITEQQFADCDLADMAYTLQVGREAMEERLAMIVGSVKELEIKLKGFVEGRDGIEALYRGQSKRNKETLAVLAADEDMVKLVDAWLAKGKYEKLLNHWVKGLNFDWNKLYGETKRCRISLPTYPFIRERYWVTENKVNSVGSLVKIATSSGVINPLLQINTSDFSEQRFSSTFTGQEFFLADHLVKGQRVLPGVAYLEIARAAVEQAAGVLGEDQVRVQLKNVGWVRPIVVGEQQVQVHIRLYPEDNGEIFYEIYSEAKVVDEEIIIHNQGIAVLTTIAEVPTMNLEALQAQCTKSTLSSDQCYGTFQSLGLGYGPGHQGIEKVYVGEDQILAKLSLPSSITNTQNQYVLHPSLMDSALQSSIGLMMNADESMPFNAIVTHKPALAFALQELEIISSCTTSMWSLMRYSEGCKAEDKVQKFDIDLCDDQGNICVRMKRFTPRVLEGEVGSVGLAVNHGTLMLQRDWKEQAIAKEAATPDYIQHLVMICEPDEVNWESFATQMERVRCLSLQSNHEAIEERFQTYAVQVFEEIKNIIQEKPRGKVLIQIVISAQVEQRLFTGLSGLLKTAQLENPRCIGQLIEVEDYTNIIEILKENSCSPMDNQIRYQDGKRLIAGWSKIDVTQKEARLPWRDGGIYLITGGAGKLGLIFAKEIAQRVKDATLILIGRTPLGDRNTQIRELEVLGARVEYRQIDVAQEKAVASLIQSIQEDFGDLHGIIHSAGVKNDSFILKKTKEVLQEVLAPKVSGLVYLDQASKHLNLDFFVLFSSITGAFGNSSQADYATANAFMDAYASYRNAQVASKQRHGQTLSINWSLWKDGGMRVDEETEKMMRQNMGIVAMQTSTSIQNFYQCLTSGKEQVIVMEGDIKKFQEIVFRQPSETEVLKTPSFKEENKAVSAIGQDLLQEKAINYFQEMLSSVIQLPAHRIDADAPLEEYGIDSIMVMQLTSHLEKIFGSLSKTLFFEYQSIQELVEYFLESYQAKMTELLEINESVELTTPHYQTFAAVTDPKKPNLGSHRRPRFASIRSEAREEKEGLDIAVIGVAGRYPGATNLQEFWNNLRDGRDCISEIHQDRWDHTLYFDEDKNNPSKNYSNWGGFLEGVDQFDPHFFNISPREAEMMDPQERLFLECVFETLEDAGYTREVLGQHHGFGLAGNVGVYVGVMYAEYHLNEAQEQIPSRLIALPGNPSSIANRVSYFCDFHGPSMAVDTTCSSSLTAIHLACQSLQQGGCELAIAGGVNVSMYPNKYLLLGQGRFASSKERCESYKQGGDGYVPGEGVGAVLLKPLSKAVADGDHIYGIIKATAINHGGKTNGYTVPNPNAQASVIGRAFKAAGIDPRMISYLEAHGTGTSLGDPIEIAGLTKVFEENTKDKQFCAIGSAKSNIGHCESAAGIAGVTKVLLQLKYRQLVPSLHSEVLNLNAEFSNTPFVVQQELGEWNQPVVNLNGEIREYPRIASISSFGAGGSNAHIVIEEYISKDLEQPPIMVTPRNPAIIMLSAKNEEQLKEQARRLLAAIQEQQFADSELADMAYTLQVGREAMEERLGLIVVSIKELTEKLKGFVEGQDEIEDLYRGQVKRNKETLAVFAADEDMQKTIEAWIDKGKHAKLLDLWVKGLIFDREKFYGDAKPRRISLPTYPFARERFGHLRYDTRAEPGTAHNQE